MGPRGTHFFSWRRKAKTVTGDAMINSWSTYDYLYFANQKAADNIHTDKGRQNTNSDLKTK